MTRLVEDRACLERTLPGFDARLAEFELTELERPAAVGVSLFRETAGAAMLVPEALGGLGVCAGDAARIQRALGSRAPSLAVGVAMHNFSVATFVAYNLFSGDGKELLTGIADQQLLIASGFAEGNSGASVLDSEMTATPTDGGFVVDGRKCPCSLSRSMDVLTAGVTIVSEHGTQRGIALIPAESAGIERRPFWSSPILAGAESDELVLKGVFVPEALVMVADEDESAGGLGTVEIGGLCWFQLLIANTYLGIAGAVAERAYVSGRGMDVDCARVGVELEGATAGLDHLATRIESGENGNALLRDSLMVRFSVQGAIGRAVSLAAELLGGLATIRDPDVAYLVSAAQMLAHHPPSRTAAAPMIAALLRGTDPVLF